MTQHAINNLAYGDKFLCRAYDNQDPYGNCAGTVLDTTVIHASKKCFKTVSPYTPVFTLPEYVVEKDKDLYLNIIDPETPLFCLELFTRSLDFIDKHIKHRQVLVHCDKGLSRSPSIVLLWLAKRLHNISNQSYIEAFDDFVIKKKYPYKPGRGIAIYLEENWSKIC